MSMPMGSPGTCMSWTFFFSLHFIKENRNGSRLINLSNSLQLSFSNEPSAILASGEYLYAKVKILRDNKALNLRYAKFVEYTNNNGLTFSVEMGDSEEITLFVRVATRDNKGKLQLVHNPTSSNRVLSAHEQSCSACLNFKACSRSCYHSISVTVDESELMLFLHMQSDTPTPCQLLISTSNRNECALSSPVTIVDHASGENSMFMIFLFIF